MLQLRPWALQHAESAITLGCLYESPGMPAGASPRMLGDRECHSQVGNSHFQT